MNTLYVGIDVSSKSNVAYLMKSDGSKHSILTVDNNRTGAQKLVDRITSVLQTLDDPNVVIGMEATSVYGDNLMYFLRESGSLANFKRRLHMLNPKQVKKFKDAYSDLPKNDPTDAFVIADNLRFGRITKEVYMDDYRYQALKVLTRARFQLVQSLTREKQRFLNGLVIKFSGLAQENIFSDTFGSASMALIEKFDSVDELAYMDTEELTPLVKPLLSIPVPNIKVPSTNFLTSQKLVKSSAHRHYLISFAFITISNSFLQCAPLHLTYMPLQTAFSSAIIGVGHLQRGHKILCFLGFTGFISFPFLKKDLKKFLMYGILYKNYTYIGRFCHEKNCLNINCRNYAVYRL